MPIVDVTNGRVTCPGCGFGPIRIGYTGKNPPKRVQLTCSDGEHDAVATRKTREPEPEPEPEPEGEEEEEDSDDEEEEEEPEGEEGEAREEAILS